MRKPSAVVVVAVLCFLMVMHFIVKADEKLVTCSRELPVQEYVPEILAGEVYEQVLHCERGNLQQIQVFLATFNRVNHSTLTVTLTGEDGTQIQTWTKDCTLMLDNRYYTFDLGRTITESSGKTYRLTITSDAAEGEGITLYCNTDEGSEGLSCNGEDRQAALCCRLVYRRDVTDLLSGANGFHIRALAVCVMAGLLAAWICGRHRTIRTEYVFLLLWTCVCMMQLFSGTLFRAPDEERHFARALEISEGYPVSEYNEEKAAGGRELPLVNVDLSLLERSWESYSGNKDMQLSEDTVFWDFSNLALYAPVSYIPQATGMFIARHLGLSVAGIAYAGRLANLACITLLLFWAIRLLPFGKEALLLTALIPMNVFEAVTLAPDGMVVALTAFMIAYVLHLRYVRSCSRRLRLAELTWLYVLAGLISLYKIVYLPFCLLYLLIPADAFGGRKKKWFHLLLMAALAAGLNLWWLGICRRFLVTRGTDAAAQLRYVLAHPFCFFVILARTYFDNSDRWLSTMLGISLGELNVETSGLFIFLYAILLGIKFHPAIRKSRRPERRVALVMGLVDAAAFILIPAGLYVQWTAVGSNIVLGLQGRYFLALLPPLYFILNGEESTEQYGRECTEDAEHTEGTNGRRDTGRNDRKSAECSVCGRCGVRALTCILCINACAAMDMLFSCITLA